MSIEIKNLLKTYGEQKAVNNISFKIEKGEIVGFLGPNGAGKSTTMKILTGYLKQNSGEAIVCGINVAEDPLATKENWLSTRAECLVLRYVCKRIFSFYSRST